MAKKRATPDDATLPRKLKNPVSTVDAALDAGPDLFFASRQAGGGSLRQCLASLFSLASSLHTPQLSYYSKTLETSRARHVTVEQIWGQMNMLLRPVLRRLQENVQRAVEGPPPATNDGAPEGRPKRPRGEDSGEEQGGDVPPAPASELSESDLDEDIAQLLVEQKRQRQEKSGKGNKSSGRGDTWRYVFGNADDKEDEDDWDDDADKERNDDDDGDGDDGDARIRRRHAQAMAAADDEELAALKEMYGDDFVPGEEDDDEAVDSDEDPQFEEDLASDDLNATFNERDGRYFGNDDILAEDDVTNQLEEGQENDVDDNGDDAELNDPNLTELQRERLRERRLVERLEQERLYSTNWAMTGEVSGKNRPRDALVDEELDFEHATKAVPVITAAVTAKLEDRIRRRILDANYDDVQRRTEMSAPGDLVTTRRDATLDSEKSKLSLMDLYEKEYRDRMRAAEEANGDTLQTAEPLTEIEKDELRAIHMWRRLAQHLDALSNFHYTPKPVQEDLAARVRAVDGQAPAITLETVGNFATTRENALAPQDLYRGADTKYADVGSNELVPRERRALRRAKKVQVGAARDRKEKRVAQAKKLKQQKQS